MLEQAASAEMVTTNTDSRKLARVPLLTYKCKFEILKDLPCKDFIQQIVTLKSQNNPTRL